MNQSEKAEKIYRELIKRNPENNAYYHGVEKCFEAQGKCEFFNIHWNLSREKFRFI